MIEKVYTYFSYAYHSLCLLFAAILSAKGIYQFSLDEDLTLTTYKDFHSDETSIYPSISFCSGSIFDEKKLNRYGVTSTKYMSFLKGHNLSQDLSRIPYEYVTINPLDYLLGIEIYQQLPNKRINREQHYWHDYTTGNRSKENFGNSHLYVDQYNDWLGTPYKCMTLDVPYIKNEHLNRIVVVIKRSIFPDSKRPQVINHSNLFLVSLSYPNQRLRHSNEKTTWI